MFPAHLPALSNCEVCMKSQLDPPIKISWTICIQCFTYLNVLFIALYWYRTGEAGIISVKMQNSKWIFLPILSIVVQLSKTASLERWVSGECWRAALLGGWRRLCWLTFHRICAKSNILCIGLTFVTSADERCETERGGGTLTVAVRSRGHPSWVLSSHGRRRKKLTREF